MEKIFSRRWFQKIESRYPVTEELLQSQISQEKIFAGVVGGAILLLLYILVMLMDLI